MENFQIIHPNPLWIEEIKNVAQEFKKYPTAFDICHMKKIVQAFNENDFNGYFKFSEDMRGVNVPRGFVPSSFLWIIKDEKIVAIADIRHMLNDYLRNVCAGHLAYEMVPSYRGKGLMTSIAKMLLKYARDNFGIEEALITCHIENIASYKVMTKLMNELGGHPDTDTIVDGHIEKRCWVKTQKDI